MAGGMPLAFTQEDFLVLKMFDKKVHWVPLITSTVTTSTRLQ